MERGGDIDNIILYNCFFEMWSGVVILTISFCRTASLKWERARSRRERFGKGVLDCGIVRNIVKRGTMDDWIVRLCNG